MDDPWGSPWADDAPLEDKKAVGGGSEAILKTQNPVKAATLALQVNTNSPWEDNETIDDFGDWSVSPAVEYQDVNKLRPKEDVAWLGDVAHDEGSESHPKLLSPSWEENIILPQTPKLAPSPIPKELRRQSSPDPWATTFRADDGLKGTLTQDATLEDRVTDSDHETTHRAPSNIRDSPPASSELPVDSEVRTPTNNGTSLDQDDVKALGSPQRITEQAQSPQTAELTPSRPASSPSTGSQHEGAPDSSRTSFDEEPKRPQMPRKVSSKIQNLVEHFDGLANQGEEGPQDVSRTRSQSREKLEGKSDESADDFGDFEEENLGSERDESAEEVDGANQTIAANHASNTEIASSSPIQSPKDRTVKEPTSPYRTLGPSIKPVQIDVDLAILDTLYPSEETIPSQEPIFIPDTLPHDSFSSTEERKMWYRISRYGTMRQHNSGDDENYVRISWPKSNVRDDTLKIVARWMDEDRISGQIILGGAGRTTSLFGWNDSKVAPVSLETVFAAKSRITAPPATRSVGPEITGNQHVPSLSPISPSVQEHHPRSAVHAPFASEEFNASPVSPVANFGWNTAPDSAGSLEQTNKLPNPRFAMNKEGLPKAPSLISPPRDSLSPIRPIALPETFKVIEPPQPTPVTPFETNIKISASSSPLSTPTSLSTATSNQNDEDDDWGDLVSSPTVANTAVFQPPQPLRHKKSQSLNDSGLSSFAKSGSLGLQLQQNRFGHRSNPSADEALSPRYQETIATAPSSSGLDVLASPVAVSTSKGPDGHTAGFQAPAAPNASDSWASMDFSFFDTPSVPKQALSPAIQSGTALKKAPGSGSISTIAAPTTSLEKRQDAEQNQIVQRIVGGLPDLSYMLRR